MKAGQIMTHAPLCVTRQETIRRAAALMRDLDVGFIPVVDDYQTLRLAGVITDRDIAIRCVAEGYRESDTVGDCMTSGFIARVDVDDDVEEAIRHMRERQLRRIPVVAEDDRLVGVISQADLATAGRDPREVAMTLARVSEPAAPRRPVLERAVFPLAGDSGYVDRVAING